MQSVALLPPKQDSAQAPSLHFAPLDMALGRKDGVLDIKKLST